MRELYSHSRSMIHQMDARVKVIFTLAFIFFLSLTPINAWPAYILFLTMILSVLLISRLSIVFMLKRSLLALPFVLAAIPLIFIGQPPFVAMRVFQGVQIPFSPEGFTRFASIMLKSWISVQAAILLVATTRFPDLLIAFQQLRVPRVFVAIIGLMWRYLYVISEEVSRMLRAQSSRSATMPDSHHSRGTLFWRAKVTGGMAGSLFLRSIERSERVYSAMLSRGYKGVLPISSTTPFSKNDRLRLIVAIFLLLLLWALGFLIGG